MRGKCIAPACLIGHPSPPLALVDLAERVVDQLAGRSPALLNRILDRATIRPAMLALLSAIPTSFS
jgi:hypothetical protein